MNKYKKMAKELEQEHKRAYECYCEKREECKNKAASACQKYNDQIGVINSLRHELRCEISDLYKFLKEFGNIGKRITPFDYVTEDSRATSYGERQEFNHYEETQKEQSKWGKTIKVAAVLVEPGILPVLAISDFFKSRSDAKEAYNNFVMKCENEKMQWEKEICEFKDYVTFYDTAREIANVFRALIATVKDAIAETILPELSGITAFLYADAVKNCIISGMDPADAEAASIGEYKGTIFDSHYTFVMNAFDYYTTIVKFFTKPVLTNIVADDQITDNEKTNFYKDVEIIQKRTKLLTSNAMFGGIHNE